MKIFVAGGTGAIGCRLLPLLVDAGHEVVSLTRSSEGAAIVRDFGAVPALADALDSAALRQAVLDARPEVVVNQLTSIPERLNPRRIERDMAATNRLRTEATRTLVEAARDAGTRRVVSQSISFVYRPDGRGAATEDAELYRPAPKAFRPLVDAVYESERLVLEGEEPKGIVLRYGYFYGPGTAYAEDGAFTDDMRHRRVPIVGSGSGVCSFIHVDDAAAATVAAVERGASGAYNIVDDEPAPVAEWLPVFARLVGARPPRRIPTLLGRLAAGPYGVYYMTRQRGASNAKAKAELGWRPRYASWRDGFRADSVGG